MRGRREEEEYADNVWSEGRSRRGGPTWEIQKCNERRRKQRLAMARRPEELDAYFVLENGGDERGEVLRAPRGQEVKRENLGERKRRKSCGHLAGTGQEEEGLERL